VKDKLFYQNKNNKNNEKKCIIFTPFNISNPDYKLTETFVKYLRLAFSVYYNNIINI
jgi:hypothetical protein